MEGYHDGDYDNNNDNGSNNDNDTSSSEDDNNNNDTSSSEDEDQDEEEEDEDDDWAQRMYNLGRSEAQRDQRDMYRGNQYPTNANHTQAWLDGYRSILPDDHNNPYNNQGVDDEDYHDGDVNNNDDDDNNNYVDTSSSDDEEEEDNYEIPDHIQDGNAYTQGRNRALRDIDDGWPNQYPNLGQNYGEDDDWLEGYRSQFQEDYDQGNQGNQGNNVFNIDDDDDDNVEFVDNQPNNNPANVVQHEESEDDESEEDDEPQEAIDVDKGGPVRQEIPKKCPYCYSNLINGSDIIRTDCPSGFHHYIHKACFDDNNRISPGKCPQGPGAHRYNNYENIGRNPQGGGYRKHKNHMTRRLINKNGRNGRKRNISIKGVNIKGRIREVQISKKGNITVRGNIYGVKVGKRKSIKNINKNINKRIKLTRKMINKKFKLTRRLLNRIRNKKMKKSRKIENRNKIINRNRNKKSRRK